MGYANVYGGGICGCFAAIVSVSGNAIGVNNRHFNHAKGAKLWNSIIPL